MTHSRFTDAQTAFIIWQGEEGRERPWRSGRRESARRLISTGRRSMAPYVERDVKRRAKLTPDRGRILPPRSRDVAHI